MSLPELLPDDDRLGHRTPPPSTPVPTPITMPETCACGCDMSTSSATMAAVSVSDEGHLAEGLGLLAREACATRLVQARHMAGLKTAIIHPEVAKGATTITSAGIAVAKSRRHVYPTEHYLYQVD